MKQSETDISMEVTCEDGTKMTLDKEKSTPLDDMVLAVKTNRMKCTQCSPPPSFFNSKKEFIQAESSFGIPYHFSNSKMIAKDFKRLVDENDLDDSWATNFMQKLLKSPKEAAQISHRLKKLFNFFRKNYYVDSLPLRLQHRHWDVLEMVTEMSLICSSSTA